MVMTIQNCQQRLSAFYLQYNKRKNNIKIEKDNKQKNGGKTHTKTEQPSAK